MTIYFDDMPEGWGFRTASRTILDADIINFAGVSGDFNALHIDEEFARARGFGRRVAHGMLIASIVTGLKSPFDDMAMVAFLETSRRFVGPVFPGETIYAEFKVVSRRLSSKKPTQGVVTFDVSTKKSDGSIVQTGVDACMIEKRAE